MIINANAHDPVGIRMDLVYSYSPNGTYSNKVEVDLRSCRFVCISFMTDRVDQLFCTDIMPVDSSGPTSNTITYYKSKYKYYRGYTIEPDGITFGDSGRSNASSGEIQDTDQLYMIPYRIYTIR